MITLLKLGGSLITDKTKPYTPRMDALRNAATEIKAAHDHGISLIVGHGGGSFGHAAAQKHRELSREGVAEIQDAMSRLNEIVIEELHGAGVPAVAFPPRGCTAENGNVVRWNVQALPRLIEDGFLPVVHGDVVRDTKRGFSILSTEDLFLHLASHLSVQRVVAAGSVEGVLDNTGRLIREITPQSLPNVRAQLSTAAGIDVTGGMKHKVETLLRLASSVDILLVNGTKARIRPALQGSSVTGTYLRS